jgi:glycosyltransferase involved in cell wall biosynthesis
MKIVIVHHFYKNGAASGENTVVEAHVRALRKYGHTVTLIGRYSIQTLNSRFERLRVGVTWALNMGHSPWRQIKEMKPDIILIHNLYPGFSSRWIRKKEIPRIYWLHNYRFFCLASTFVFRNQECLICAQSVSYKSLIRKCADGSIPKTVSSYLRLKINRDLPERSELNHWVALSPKARNLFLQTSLNSNSISVIPNFVDSNDVTPTFLSDKWIFVGRLTAEKGIIALANNVPDSIQLDIYGDGPARAQLEDISTTKKNLNLKGVLDRGTLLDLLPTYTGGFVPSLGIEGIPTTFLEFSAAGLPIIGWEMNSTSDFIDEYECGITLKHFKMETITDAVNEITRNRVQFSKNSKRMWKLEFSETKWIQQVNDLFDAVINHRNVEY